MDERHWWIASKVQECLHIGGDDNPVVLEDFISKDENLDLINSFLEEGAVVQRLFFYSPYLESNDSPLNVDQLGITASNLTDIRNAKASQGSELRIIYFLRHETEHEISTSAAQFVNEIFTGEIKFETLESLTSILSDIFLPSLKTKANWGICSDDQQRSLLSSIEKYSNTLGEAAKLSYNTTKQKILRVPNNLINAESAYQRIGNIEPEFLEEYEKLVSEWIVTIEGILFDNSEERIVEASSGPLAEIERLQRRYRTLTALTEQLKSKDCKNIIGTLITGKSKLLKKWKTVDIGITDVVNDTRDKLKYNEALKKHYSLLYNKATPQQILTASLPGMFAAMKQMDSASRFYSRSGYLGQLLVKIANQIIVAIKSYLSTFCISPNEKDRLWNIVEEELTKVELKDFHEMTPKQFNNLLELKAKANRNMPIVKGNTKSKALLRGDTNANADIGIDTTILIGKVRACLLIQLQYKEHVRNLRDTLGAHGPLTFSGRSSIQSGVPTNARQKVEDGNASPNKSPMKAASSNNSTTVGQADYHGVSIMDEDTLFGRLSSLCSRLRVLLDLLQQTFLLQKVEQQTRGLPKPRKLDISLDPDEVDYSDDPKQQYRKSKFGKKFAKGQADNKSPERRSPSPEALVESPSGERGPHAPLKAIEEDIEEGDSHVGDIPNKNDSSTIEEQKEEEKMILAHYYGNECEGPSVSQVIREYLQMLKSLTSSKINTYLLLDIDSKDKGKLEEAHQEFCRSTKELDKFFCGYMHAILLRPMTTNAALDIITRFNLVKNRAIVKSVMNEVMVEIFSEFDLDLEEVRTLYMEHKENPPPPRNSPPVAGAISWSRKLLKQIEEPMAIFRDCRAVTTLSDYSRVVKIYNKIATTLVTFETLYFNQWKANIEACRDSLKYSLIVIDPTTKRYVVNIDSHLKELIQETKWLRRMNFSLPDSAVQTLLQEHKVRSYENNMKECVQKFYQIIEEIPANLQPLLKAQIEQTREAFQPGVSLLAWNSMNIDAFLHNLRTVILNLETVSNDIKRILAKDVDAPLQNMVDTFLLDFELAFSKSWPVEEFLESMSNSLKEKIGLLKKDIEKIEAGLKAVAKRISNRKNIFDKRKSYQSKPMITSSGDGLSEDQVLAQLLNHYYGEVYCAILNSTCRSLIIIAESAGCPPDDLISVLSPLLTLPCGEVQQVIDDTPLNSDRQPGEQSRRAISAGSQSESSVTHRSATDTPVELLIDQAGGETNENGFLQSINQPLASTREEDAPSSHHNRIRSSLSRLSNFSRMTWNGDDLITFLKFDVNIKYCVPDLIIEPELSTVKTTLMTITRNIMESFTEISWFGNQSAGEAYYQRMNEDHAMHELVSKIESITDELGVTIHQQLDKLASYDFLWKDNLRVAFTEFLSLSPTHHQIHNEVERLLRLERQISRIPDVIPIGCVSLKTFHARDVLHEQSKSWKEAFASALHMEAKNQLDAAVSYRISVRSRLEQEVHTLSELNQSLKLLEEVADTNNEIDSVYLPIEKQYEELSDHLRLRIPRREMQQVRGLREEWQEVLKLAEFVSHDLLKERGSAFIQELDKQLKNFVVEVIQFRNSFDSQGPAIPGIQPSVAVTKLHEFQLLYVNYDEKRKTLDSVLKLFSLPGKSFPELDKTGEELHLLNMLYGLFQQFIKFDLTFRDTLWSDLDLEATKREVEGYWDECLALPSKLKDWEAFYNMKSNIQFYLQILPILESLATKEIRTRHWLQVMQITASSFSLDSNIFKLNDLMDIGLSSKKNEIMEICRCAKKEQELEIKMRLIEEEWTEQVLSFKHYKRKGPILLDKTYTERCLEQLEDSQATLAMMLTSRHIGPLRTEAAAWAEKLREVGEVLELWLEVQELWINLEAVFSIPETSKELPQEAKRFDRLDKSYVKMMKRAFDTKNLLQCCYGGDVPKSVVLRHILEELEICYKSLITFLDQKRQAFPRFYFLTDSVLLSMLSSPNNLESVNPYLMSVFTAIHSVQSERRISDNTVTLYSRNISTRGSTTKQISTHPAATDQPLGVKIEMNTSHAASPEETSSKGARRSQQSHLSGNDSKQQMSLLVEETMQDEFSVLELTSVKSIEGEMLLLDNKVTLEYTVESWLSELQNNVGETLTRLAKNVIADINEGGPLDELAYRYPSQICRLGLLYYWTKECELSILDIRNERKSLHNLAKKYNITMTRLPTILTRGAWKTISDSMLPFHKIRLENMITQALYLRDCLESLTGRKIREITDFEWRRNVRCYVYDKGHDIIDQPIIYIADNPFNCGTEFYGAQPVLALTPFTERCYIAMVTAMNQFRGSMIQGAAGVGKTETVRGLAQTISIHLCINQSREHVDRTALGKLLQGLAMDGCWGLFDDVDKFSLESFSVLMDHMQAVYSAMKMELEKCYLGEGQEFLLSKSTSIFLTYNPTSTGSSLPLHLKSHFRSVTLLQPDVGQILKAKCTGLGFKSPHVLASRLKIVSELTRDLFTLEPNNQMSLTCLSNILDRANQKKKLFNTESLNKQDSQSSTTPAAAPGINEYWPPYREKAVLAQPIAGQRKTGKVDMAAAYKTMYGKKSNTPPALTSAAKMEHGFVCQVVYEILGPRLDSDMQNALKGVLKDVFHGITEPPTKIGNPIEHHLGQALMTSARVKGFSNFKSWIEKCSQIYNVSTVHTGLIICGPAASGKSSALENLIDALSSLAHQPSAAQTKKTENTNGDSSDAPEMPSTSNKTEDGKTFGQHRLQRIFPLMLDNDEDLFGHMKYGHEWMDGVVTTVWRKSRRNQSTTWLCLDGPMQTNWSDHFTSVLDSSRTFHLANGDRIFLPDNVKLVFETENLSEATPALVSRTGVIYFGPDTLGWKPIAQTWLEGRPSLQTKPLSKLFDKVMDSVIRFVTVDVKPTITLPIVSLFQSCLQLLSAMLQENKEIGTEVHVERLFLFCLLWSFGGFLSDQEKKDFSDLLKTLTPALPDDDRDINVFDYYIDDSGEWDPWISKVSENVNSENFPFSGECLVDTIDTVRIRLLMEYSYISKQNVLLVGPRGSGKSVILNDFLNCFDPNAVVQQTIVYSKLTNAAFMQNFVESQLYHRQGFVYGAKENRRLVLTIDDLNLPHNDVGPYQPLGQSQNCNEFLRQLIDAKCLITTQRPFEWHNVEGLNVFATIATSDSPGLLFNSVGQRLMRHFVLINVPQSEGNTLRTIVKGIFEVQLAEMGEVTGLDIEAIQKLTDASCQLLERVRETLRISPVPGRQYYLFNLKDLNVLGMCLKKMTESRDEEQLVVNYWVHEIQRVFRDQISRTADVYAFDQILHDIYGTVYGHLTPLMQDRIYITFPNTSRFHQRPQSANSGSKRVKAVLSCIDEYEEVRDNLAANLKRYNEEFGNEYLEISLSNNAIRQIIRIHRAMSIPYNGHLVMIGAIGCHLSTLCRLALHVAELPVHLIDTSKKNTFFDSLRSAVRQTGTEGKMLALLLTGRGLADPVYLDALNSIVSCGLYPGLFSSDEMDGLFQAIAPSLKKDHPGTSIDPMRHFLSRVRKNLHIILCLEPSHYLLQTSLQSFPALLAKCQLNFVKDWTPDALLAEATYFLSCHKDIQLSDKRSGVVKSPSIIDSPRKDEAKKSEVGSTTGKDQSTDGTPHLEDEEASSNPEEAVVESHPDNPGKEEFDDSESALSDKELVARCLAQLHNFVLSECNQKPWSGPTSSKIRLNKIRIIEKKKDTNTKTTVTSEVIRVVSDLMPNRPYTKAILLEQIKSRQFPADQVSPMSVPLGPLTFQRLLKIFRYVYTHKCTERSRRVRLLQSTLVSLDQCRHDVQVMRRAIKEIKLQYSDSCKNADKLFKTLAAKVTRLEKVRAYLGYSSTLDVFLKMHELEEEQIEDDPLLDSSEYDEFDREFDKMREESMKHRQEQVKKDLVTARQKYEQHRKELEHAREQVNYWRSKVDRQCVERIKAFQNPPYLVGQVMEMIFYLIGKSFPGMHHIDRSNTDNYPPNDSSSGRISTSGSVQVKREKTNISMAAGKTKEDRVDRTTWKYMQQSMNDAVKFVEMLQNIPWEDGLDQDTLRAVESYLAHSRDGQLGITGEGTLLENPESLNIRPSKRTTSPNTTASSGAITIAAAKYSSEDAATLVQYTIALMEYSSHCQPLKQALDKMHELQREIEDKEKAQKEAELQSEMAVDEEKEEEQHEDTYSEEDIPKLEEEVGGLQKQYDKSIVEKYRLEMELKSMEERVRACMGILEKMRDTEKTWRHFTAEHPSNDVLLANSLIVSAFVTYCGPLDTDQRQRLSLKFQEICSANNLTRSNSVVFRDIDLISFLFSEVDIGNLSRLSLPKTPLLLENASLLMLEGHCDAWPLICDASRLVIDWLEKYLSHYPLHVVKYDDLRLQLETCLSDGSVLVITDCDMTLLAKDRRIRQVLVNQRLFLESNAPFKLMIQEHEVECQPSFRLFLHTSQLPGQVPQTLAAYTNLIRFALTRDCLEETLLDRFLEVEKSRLEAERKDTIYEKQTNLRLMYTLEEQMIDNLSSGVRLMNNLSLTKKLTDLKKQHDETLDNRSRLENLEHGIMKARESYRPIAKRGAVCLDTSLYLSVLNRFYLFSYEQFRSLYDVAIQHSDRASVKAVMDRLTHASHQMTSRALTEKDRIIFNLFLSLEVCDSIGQLNIGEREYIISPLFGAAVVQAAKSKQAERENKPPPGESSKVAQIKKPFEWMTDDAFNNLQALAMHYDWFQDMFDRMSRDGRETQWRTLIENEQPEHAPLPDKMDETFTPLQRLCVCRAVRPDRLMQLIHIFVNNVLGKKFSGDIYPDLSAAMKTSSPSIPILILYENEASLSERIFKDFCTKSKQSNYSIVQVNDSSVQTERRVKRAIQKSLSDSGWVLLHTAAQSPSIMLTAMNFLCEHVTTNTESNIRLFMSVEMTGHVPLSIIQASTRVVIDPSHYMKENLLRSFTKVDNDQLKSNNRSEFPAVLHNLFFMHAAIKLRCRFPVTGWSRVPDLLGLGDEELSQALSVVCREMEDSLNGPSLDTPHLSRSPSWQSVKYLLSEIIYGANITDNSDLLSLAAIIDFWLTPNSFKRDFELVKLKYKIPSVFFSSNTTKIQAMIQAMDSIPPYYLDCPEACNLHPSPDNLLADDQYIFTHLNAILDAMPEGSTLKHSLFDKPPEPQKVPFNSMVSGNTQHPLVAIHGRLATGSLYHMRTKKEVELWELCNSLLLKVPKVYTKESIQDKIKKLTSQNPVFNNLIARELEALSKLTSCIKHSLQTIKTAIDLQNLGDRLNDHLVEVADSLFYSRIPNQWLQLAGVTAPPATYALTSWLSELNARGQHLEKMLLQGREKTPAFNLGAFCNPRGLLALFKQEAYQQIGKIDRSGNIEQIIFQTELTSRDKDHLREPPAEGAFVWGFYLWNCAWDKGSSCLSDVQSKTPYVALPVVHLTCLPLEASVLHHPDNARALENFECPVYHSRYTQSDPVLEMSLHHEGIMASRWSLRGVICTLRPY